MPVEQMNLSLPPKTGRLIRDKVKAGNYTDASEVVRDAVRPMQEVEASRNDCRALAAMDDPDDAAGEVRRSARATSAALDKMIAAKKSQKELVQYVFDKHGCKTCHTAVENGKLGLMKKKRKATGQRV